MSALASKLAVAGLALASLAWGAGCAASELDPEAFRKEPPPAEGEAKLTVPVAEEATLGNGLRVIVVPRPDLPIVTIELAIRRGADQGAPGLVDFAAAMRVRGTKTQSALAFVEAADAAGGGVRSFANYDGTFVRASGLSAKLGQLLDLVGGATRSPSFDPAEIERERTGRLTSLAQRRGRPMAETDDLVRSVLYPAGHPYASSLFGDERSVAAITRADLERVHAATVGPTDAVLAVAGDATLAQVRAEAERVFGDWKSTQKPRIELPVPPPPAKSQRRVVLLERPGVTQSQVTLAALGVAVDTPDHPAVLVMKSALAGRIERSLREVHHVTYDVGTGFDMRLGPGPFTMTSAVETRYATAAARQMLKEVKRLQHERVNSREMVRARAAVVRSIPRYFETVTATAASLGDLSIYGRQLDWIARRESLLDAVKADDVLRAAQEHFPEDGLFVLVVGDPSLVPTLATLGLGEVDVRSGGPATE